MVVVAWMNLQWLDQLVSNLQLIKNYSLRFLDVNFDDDVELAAAAIVVAMAVADSLYRANF